MSIPQNWIERAKNKDYFYNSYLNRFRTPKEIVDSWFDRAHTLQIENPEEFARLWKEAFEKAPPIEWLILPEGEEELKFNNKYIWELK